jgi:hypothetical protein
MFDFSLFSESKVIPTTKGAESKKQLKYILYWNEAYGTTEYGFCCGQVFKKGNFNLIHFKQKGSLYQTGNSYSDNMF